MTHDIELFEPKLVPVRCHDGQSFERQTPGDDHFVAAPTRPSPGTSNPPGVSKGPSESSTSLHTAPRSWGGGWAIVALNAPKASRATRTYSSELSALKGTD